MKKAFLALIAALVLFAGCAGYYTEEHWPLAMAAMRAQMRSAVLGDEQHPFRVTLINNTDFYARCSVGNGRYYPMGSAVNRVSEVMEFMPRQWDRRIAGSDRNRIYCEFYSPPPVSALYARGEAWFTIRYLSDHEYYLSWINPQII